MTVAVDERTWKQHFQIQSVADLDFVIGQMLGWPIGMSRNSPPEFRRRVLAAAVSYQLQKLLCVIGPWGLALCLVVLDVFVEVIRHLYKDRSDTLVLRIQYGLHRDTLRKTYQAVAKITELSGLDDLREIQSFLS